MFELQPLQSVPNGLQIGDADTGSCIAFTTRDATPVEVLRREIPEDVSTFVAATLIWAATAADSLGTVSTNTQQSRVGAAAPSFNTGNPSIGIGDPDAIGVGFTVVLDGNEIVLSVVGVAATVIRWKGQIGTVITLPNS